MGFYNLSKKSKRKTMLPLKIQVDIRQFFLKIGDFLPKKG